MPDSALRERWSRLAFRLAFGVEMVGHLEPLVDEVRLAVGFCGYSPDLAELLRAAIERENVAAIVGAAHPQAGQPAACDVLLPCHPDAPDDEINHAVLAAVKAAHVYLCARPLG